jgi:hypothetical protein
MMPDLLRLFYPCRYAYRVQVKHHLGASAISVAAQELGFQPTPERGGEVLLLVALAAERDNGLPLWP